jgi:chloramphenicol 3-O-phosphotransferase
MRKVLLEMVGVRSEAEWDEMLEARRRARKRAYQRAWYAKRANHPEARRT